MKIVPYDTLIPDVAGIQPNIAWLLAHVPDASEVLEDLQLKYSKLQGKILQLESEVLEFEEGDVLVILPDDEGRDLEVTEEALRTALAELIVHRGEQRLEKEARYAVAYGYHGSNYGRTDPDEGDEIQVSGVLDPCVPDNWGDATKLVQGTGYLDPPCINFELTAEEVKRWKDVVDSLEYWSVNDAIEQARIDHEETEALETAKVTAAALGRIRDHLPVCNGCSDNIPDIDFDGQPLD